DAGGFTVIGSRIVARAAIQGIDARATGEKVVVAFAEQAVGTLATLELIVARATLDDVCVVVADQKILAAAAGDVFEAVKFIAGLKAVGALRAWGRLAIRQTVLVDAALETEIDENTHVGVVVGDCVDAVAADQEVLRAAVASNRVVARIAEQCVVAV